jgi:hypothetical protein
MMSRLTWVAALVVAAALALPAQTSTTGQITGAVLDPSGAVVTGAQVTLSGASGEQRTQVTDHEGTYRFALLTPGGYNVKVEAKGFQPFIANAIPVTITQTTEVVAQLSVAARTDALQVTAEAPLVQSSSPTTGRVIGEEQVRQLPLPTRNFQQLLALSPGTVASLSNNTEMGRGDVNISVNGQRTTSNNVVIDGTQVNSVGTNSTPNVSTPSPDAIQEFIVQTSMYDATLGRNSGGNIAVVTKSGTNALHGSVFEFLRNRQLNANDFFLNAKGRPRPFLTRNQFGATIGGPVIKDKTFFFFSYQGTRERNGASLNNSLTFPNIPAGLTNDRSDTALNALNAAFYTPGTTVAPISPITRKMLQAKLPNGDWAIASAAGAAASPILPVSTPLSGVSRFDDNQYIINIDHQFTPSNRLTGKTLLSNTPQYQSLFSFVGANPVQLPGYGGNIEFKNRVVSLQDTHIFKSGWINDAHFGFSRIDGPSTPQEPFKASDFGINNPLCAGSPQFCGMPTIQVLGLFSLGSTVLSDQRSTVNTLEWTDMLSVTKGKHFLRTGVEYRRYVVDFYFNFFSRGQVNFNSFKDFLAGNIAFGLLGNGVRDREMRAQDFAWYVQDDWRVSSRLTINAGMRLQYQGGISETQGRLVSFDPTQFFANKLPCTIAAPCTGNNGFRILKPGEPISPNDWSAAPRLGFAFKPAANRNLAIRGGTGLYFDRFSTRVANLQIFNYPFGITGLGLGSFASPFPDLSNVTFPVSGAPIPSPVPFYFAGIPLPTNRTPISGIYVSPDFRTPYVLQYNLSVQWEPRRNWLIEAGYVGSKGTKLTNIYTLNQGTQASTAPYTASGFSANKVLNGLQMATTDANSNYNSLQTSLTKRFSSGLQFLASYTWSKSIDDVSGASTNEFVALPGNQQSRSAQRAVSDFYRPHRFVLSGIYDLPKFYKGGSAVASALVNHWQTGGIMTLQTGSPFSVACIIGADTYNLADLVPGASFNVGGSVTSKLNNYFNKSAFAGSCTNTLPFGTAPRNLLRGPDQRNVDLSLVKFFPVRERFKTELRAEFFNAFNIVNFANPNNNVVVPFTLGTITSTSTGPRVIQFALKFSF